jgi:hypothetical protein
MELFERSQKHPVGGVRARWLPARGNDQPGRAERQESVARDASARRRIEGVSAASASKGIESPSQRGTSQRAEPARDVPHEEE